MNRLRRNEDDVAARMLLAILNGVSAVDRLAMATQPPAPEFDAALDGLCRRGLVLRLNSLAGERPRPA